MPSRSVIIAVSFFGVLLLADFATIIADEEAPEKVLAVVNGQKITQGDLDFLLLSRRVPEAKKDEVRERFLELLIERRLMREFLDSRKARPSQNELDEQVVRVLSLIRDGGDDPDQVLAKLGMTRETLRRELALPLTWKSYLRLIVTGDSLRKYFEKHRATFDGTRIRVSQIFLKVPPGSDEDAIQAAQKKLRDLKAELESGKLAFGPAAKQHSEAPSKTNGGDAGWITYRGKLPSAVSEAAFELKVGEISDPIRSAFGLHLMTVTDRKPGDLSLEDVRGVVFNQLSQELWRETVKSQRAKAKIEMR